MQKPVRCPNCNAEAAGRFCGDCGQKQSGRLTLQQLGGEFVARFFSAERGLWRTFAELTARPGRTARNYLAGKRATYVSPLLCYALCAAAVLLGLWLLRDVVGTTIVENLPEQYFAMLTNAGIGEPEQWAVNRYMFAIQNAYTWLGLITFILPMAIVLRVILGAKTNLAETMVVTLFALGHAMLLTAVVGQALTRVAPDAQFWISQAIYVGYSLLTVGGCYGWKWRSVVGGLLASSAACVSFFQTIKYVIGYALTTGF